MKRNETIEMSFPGMEPDGCQVDVNLEAEIVGPDGKKKIKGFYAGQGIYKIRFLPEKAGKYLYTIRGIVSETGSFVVTEADEEHHGVVRAEGIHLKYQDGRNFAGFGTTIYALAHQKDEIIDQTIDTLSKGPFNKVRMCLFPKSYNYNHNEPMNYAFQFLSGKENCVFTEENKDVYMKQTVWDVHHPDFTFWDSFERRLQQLFNLGIQVDLILFHPYDRWGFSTMSQKDNLTYLDYVIRRMAAYPNIWWSLANEYDLCFAKSMDDWDAFGNYIMENDPYHHLVGNHNCFQPFDCSKKYITHVSLQNRTMCRVPEFQRKYGKPVCYDECCYEGNLNETWGNISAKEMTRRFWQVTTLGGHCTHGETYLNPELAEDNNAIIWWAKGGKLIGESPERIAFLRKIIESFPGPLESYPTGISKVLSMPQEQMEVMMNCVSKEMRCLGAALMSMDSLEMKQHMDSEAEYTGHVGDDVILYYCDISCYARRIIELPAGRLYRIEVIDTWNMTRETIAEHVSGQGEQSTYEVQMQLPEKEYMAILCTAEE